MMDSGRLKIPRLPPVPSPDKPGKGDIYWDLSPEESRRLIKQGVETWGLSWSLEQGEQFQHYLQLLMKWNQKMNLTGLRKASDILVKLFLDSLSPLPYLPAQGHLLDLGSGAGIPGLPLKIARPGLTIRLLEASSKKISFLKEVIRCLGLEGIKAQQAFLGKGLPPRLIGAPFDLVITRAVGQEDKLLPAVQGVLPLGGRLLLMKGKNWKAELAILKGWTEKNGFRIEKPIVYSLPVFGLERALLVLTKTAQRPNPGPGVS